MNEKDLKVEEYNVLPKPATLVDYLKKHLKKFGLVLGWYDLFVAETSRAVVLPRWAGWSVNFLIQDLIEFLFKKENYGSPGAGILDHPFVIAFFDYNWSTKKNTLVMKSSAAEKHYQTLKTLQEGHLRYLERYENKFSDLLSDERKEQFEQTKKRHRELEIKVVKPTNLEDVPL